MSPVSRFGAIVWLFALVNAVDDFSFEEFLRSYAIRVEEADLPKRRQIYYSNLKLIEDHNKLGLSYKMGITPFTHLSGDEFEAAVGKNPHIGNPINDSSPYNLGEYNYTGATLADTVDWRTKGAVSEVKNQGLCGSCWAFSAVGALEGAYKIHHGKLVSLSVQQLLNCSYFDTKNLEMGCFGGTMEHAYDYLAPKGLGSDKEYPYSGGYFLFGTCPSTKVYDNVLKAHELRGYMSIRGNTKAIKEVLDKFGPVSVAIDADQDVFHNYKSGIIPADGCGSKLDHGVLVVGYGREGNEEYWIVKNSWGPKWGQDGYVYITTNTTGHPEGACGILERPSFPILK